MINKFRNNLKHNLKHNYKFFMLLTIVVLVCFTIIHKEEDIKILAAMYKYNDIMPTDLGIQNINKETAEIVELKNYKDLYLDSEDLEILKEKLREITKVTMKQGLKAFDLSILELFPNVKLLEVPNSIEYLYVNDYINCESLEEINVDVNNKYYTSFQGALYDKEMKQLYYWPHNKIEKELRFPDALTLLDLEKIPRLNEAEKLYIPKDLAAILNTERNQLKTIELDQRNTYFSMYDGVLYSKKGNLLRLYPNQNTKTEITLSKTLETLNLNMFQAGNNTISITLPKSLIKFHGYQKYGSVLLEGFSHLKEVKLQDGNANFKVKDGVLYNSDYTSLLWYPQDKIDEVFTIPDTVTMVSNDQLVKQKNLKKIKIPQSCTSLYDFSKVNIGAYVYLALPFGLDCPNLEEIFVDSGNDSYSSKDGVLFNKNISELLLYPSAKQNIEYAVPDTVTGVLFRNENVYLERILFPGIIKDINLIGTEYDMDAGPFYEQAFLKFISLKDISVRDTGIHYKTVDGILYEIENNKYSSLNGRLILKVYPLGKSETFYEIPRDVYSITKTYFLMNPFIESISAEKGSEYFYSTNTGLHYAYSKEVLVNFNEFISQKGLIGQKELIREN